MRYRGLFIAVGLLLIVNTVVLGNVAYNRSGEPDANMKLTERELPVSTGYRHEENSGVSLRINTYHPFYWDREAGDYDAFAWLDRKKLESLGFDFSKPDKNEEQYDYYERQLPRRTFAVLEYGGNAWEAWKKRLEAKLSLLEQEEKEGKKTAKDLKTMRGNIEGELTAGSHLFIIDVGNDPDALRQQYSDRARYLILPALVRVSYYGSNTSAQVHESGMRGYVELLISEINVPHNLHNQFDSRQHPNTFSTVPPFGPENGPHYQVSLRTGKRFEPWIADIVGGSTQ